MSSTPPSAQPVNTDLASRPGVPWARDAALSPPDAAEAQQRAEKWKKAVARAERHRERKRRKQAAAEKAAADAAERLEANARRMYFAGFFLLPFVWLVALIYFRNEHRDPDANPNIKRYYRNSRFFLVLYTLIFVAWFAVFEVFADGKLKGLNILYFSGQSPNGF